MNKVIYLLNIDDYAPELTALTYPHIEAYAKRIGAQCHVIDERKFPEWPVTYEKLQIHELAQKHRADWVIYIDSDALVHPELPDVTDLIPRDTVAHNACDFSPVRFADDDYFRRDGRHIGSANWLTIASSWCLDLWRPLDDLTSARAIERIYPTMGERKFMAAEHLVDDFALSRNIARFGLKFTTLTKIWEAAALHGSEFFWHQYQGTLEDRVDDEGHEIPGKISSMKRTMERWGI